MDVSGALRGHAAMLLYAALVAGSFSLGKLVAPMMDPAALNGIRFALAAGVMGGVALAGLPHAGRTLAEAARAPWRYLVLGGLLASFFVLMFVALRLTDPVSTGAVFTLAPAMAAVFGWWILRQRTTPRMAAALAIGAAGAVWVIFRGDPAALMRFQIGRGEALFLIGCAGHALYTPLSRRLNRGEPTAVYTFGIILAAGLLMTLMGAPAIASTDYAALPPQFWLVLVYLAVFTTAASFFLLQFAAMRLASARVMAWTYFVPTCIVAWEGTLGHGWVAPQVLPGIGLTVLALLLLLREEGPRPARPPARTAA